MMFTEAERRLFDCPCAGLGCAVTVWKGFMFEWPCPNECPAPLVHVQVNRRPRICR